MRFIADLGQKHGVKVSYEPWCFSVRTPSWEGCWDVVRKVDHPFLGLCIDIAHVSDTGAASFALAHPSSPLAPADSRVTHPPRRSRSRPTLAAWTR